MTSVPHHAPDARTRRRRSTLIVAGLVLASFLAACSDDADTSAPDGSTTEASTSEGSATESSATEDVATRLIAHEAGETEVPVDADAVVALDENAALLLLDVGIEPVGVVAAFASEGAAAILDDAGVEVVDAMAGDPRETVIEWSPDVIVSTAHPDATDRYQDWSRIAPTVLVGYAAPWDEQMALVAEIVGRQDAGEERIAALEAHLDEVARALADVEGTSVSILGSIGGTAFALPTASTSGQVTERLGLARPAAQEATPGPDGGIALSAETLGDHDAEEVLVLSGSIWSASEITDLPTVGDLTGTVTEVDGEAWTNTHPFAVSWMADDLRAVLAGEGTVAANTDAVDRWTAYRDAS